MKAKQTALSAAQNWNMTLGKVDLLDSKNDVNFRNQNQALPEARGGPRGKRRLELQRIQAHRLPKRNHLTDEKQNPITEIKHALPPTRTISWHEL